MVEKIPRIDMFSVSLLSEIWLVNVVHKLTLQHFEWFKLASYYDFVLLSGDDTVANLNEHHTSYFYKTDSFCGLTQKKSQAIFSEDPLHNIWFK
jgi:hypothetical protein